MTFDQIGLSETSRHWTYLQDENIVPQIIHGHFMRHKLDTISAWNKHDPLLVLFQYGGTDYLSKNIY